MAQEEKDSAENSDRNSNEQQNITKDYAQINIDQLRTGIK
jgi:hypothetical protein